MKTSLNHKNESVPKDIMHYLSHEVRKPIANIVGITQHILSNDFSKRDNSELQMKLDQLLKDLDYALSELENRYNGNS